MAFIKSKHINVFPSSFRHTYEDNETGDRKLFDPDSQLMSEFNITRLIDSLTVRGGFIVDYTPSKLSNGSDSVIEFYIRGYYFKIKEIDTYCKNMLEEKKDIYAKLLLVSHNAGGEIDTTNTLSSTYSIQSQISNDTSFILDKAEDGDSYDDYNFTGLSLTTDTSQESTTATEVHYLRLFIYNSNTKSYEIDSDNYLALSVKDINVNGQSMYDSLTEVTPVKEITLDNVIVTNMLNSTNVTTTGNITPAEAKKYSIGSSTMPYNEVRAGKIYSETINTNVITTSKISPTNTSAPILITTASGIMNTETGEYYGSPYSLNVLQQIVTDISTGSYTATGNIYKESNPYVYHCLKEYSLKYGVSGGSEFSPWRATINDDVGKQPYMIVEVPICSNNVRTVKVNSNNVIVWDPENNIYTSDTGESIDVYSGKFRIVIWAYVELVNGASIKDQFKVKYDYQGDRYNPGIIKSLYSSDAALTFDSSRNLVKYEELMDFQNVNISMGRLQMKVTFPVIPSNTYAGTQIVRWTITQV